MSNRELAWEKWEDDLVEDKSYDVAKSDPLDPEEGYTMEELQQALSQELPKVVATPMGVYEVYDRNKPSNQFDCWLGHTNFNITPKIKSLIEEIEGVEALKILTRYRFFVGVAKLFDFKDVRIEIERAICGKHTENREELSLDADTKLAVDDIKSKISSQKLWAIYIFPNGQIDYISSNNSDDVEYFDKLMVFKKAKEYSGGLLLTREHQQNGV
jgi:hypothetical protein